MLDSAIDPSDPGTHPRGENAPQREEGLRDWATWAAGHNDQFNLGAAFEQACQKISAPLACANSMLTATNSAPVRSNSATS